MSNHQANANPEENQEQLNLNLGTENLETNSTHSFSRRSFLGRAGASTLVAAAASAGLPALLSEKTEGQIAESDARADRSFQLRFNAAVRERNVPIPAQDNNGDEARYPNFIGNYSQGLPHNSIGEVDPIAYKALLRAVHSGNPSDFANIPLGGSTKLSGPQGGLAFDLEGTDCAQLTIPPSPKLASAERAGEMVEDYWMAMARDIPFSQYGEEPITAGAIVDLNNLSRFAGPRINGKVAAATLFRGIRPGDLTGPYLSQFFLLPVSFGTLSVAKKFNTYASGMNYLTNLAPWLAVQNGQGPFASNVVSGTSYIKNGRDLGAWVLSDIAFQAFLFAAQWLLTHGAPFNPGNPYLAIKNQTGVQTFG